MWLFTLHLAWCIAFVLVHGCVGTQLLLKTLFATEIIFVHISTMIYIIITVYHIFGFGNVKCRLPSSSFSCSFSLFILILFNARKHFDIIRKNVEIELMLSPFLHYLTCKYYCFHHSIHKSYSETLEIWSVQVKSHNALLSDSALRWT